MGDVIEFQSARLQLHGFLLRALGVTDASRWRVLSSPRQRISDGQLHAAPLLLAGRGAGELLVLDMIPTSTPSRLTPQRRLQAHLDACVGRAEGARRGCECQRVSVWIVYSNGERFELQSPLATLDGLRQRAQRYLREQGAGEMSTRKLAERWATLDASAHLSLLPDRLAHE